MHYLFQHTHLPVKSGLSRVAYDISPWILMSKPAGTSSSAGLFASLKTC